VTHTDADTHTHTHTHTHKYYSVKKKNEILLFTGKWIELEYMLNEESQVQKDKGHIFIYFPSYIEDRHKYKYIIYIYIYIYTHTHTHTHTHIVGLLEEGE
jgi:hypothetical protein